MRILKRLRLLIIIKLINKYFHHVLYYVRNRNNSVYVHMYDKYDVIYHLQVLT